VVLDRNDPAGSVAAHGGRGDPAVLDRVLDRAMPAADAPSELAHAYPFLRHEGSVNWLLSGQ
jgi:hypothetical protein